MNQNKLIYFWSLFFVLFLFCRETPVVEKEVEEVEAPKVVDEENVVVENGKAAEEAEAVAEVATPENGQSEAEPEVTSTPAAEDNEAAEEASNGDSTGMYFISYP